MKKIPACLIALSFILFLAFPGLAETPAASTAECGVMVWKVAAKDKTASASYFIGTIHNLEPKHFTNMAAILKLIDSCEVFVMEADTSKAASEASELSKYTQYPEGGNLKSDLSADLYAKTIAFMKKNFNIPEEQVDRMKPLWVSMLVQMGLEPPVAKLMDDIFKEKVGERGIKTAFLESWLAGCKLPSFIPLEEQIGSLKETIDAPEKIIEASAKLKSAYLSGNVEKLTLAALDSESGNKYPMIRKALYPDRHALWLPELEKHLKAGGAVIAVGVGHLIGESSLLESFKKKGYTIEKIESK